MAASPTGRRVAAALVAVAVAWVAFAVYNESAQSHAVDQTMQQLRARNSALQVQIDQRRREITEAQSDSWLEEQARRLGYVRNGEAVYVPVPGGRPLPPDGGIDTGPLPAYVGATATPSSTPTAPPTSAAPTPGTPGDEAAPTPVVVDPAAPGR